MTDLQIAYAKLLLEGLHRNAAVRELARRIGVDEDTIRRVLKKADRDSAPRAA